MKSIAKILGGSLIENMERLLWIKGESEMGSLESESARESKQAFRDWRQRVQLRALRRLLIKT